MHALIEAGHIDHDALVRAVADGLFFITGLDPKRKRAAVDGGQLGGGANSHTHRRGSEMPDVEMNTEALVPFGQELLHRGERRRLDDIDHHRSGQYGYASAADPRGRMLDPNEQVG